MRSRPGPSEAGFLCNYPSSIIKSSADYGHSAQIRSSGIRMLFDRYSAKKFDDLILGDDSGTEMRNAAEIGKIIFQLIEDTGSVRVAKYVGAKSSCSIPNEISVAKKKYAVKEVGLKAFSGCSSLNSVSLPDSVETIENLAFEGCSGLEAIEIPKGIRNIRGEAFRGCSRLERVTMKDSPEVIGRYAFEGCVRLREFSVEKGKGKYGSDSTGMLYDSDMGRLFRVPYATEGGVNVPPGVREISGGAFSGCASVTAIKIPSSVEKIGDRAFSGCLRLALLYVDPLNAHYRSDLQGILYDSDVTEVFKAPNSIVGALEIPATVRTVHMNAFEGCTKLVSVSIPYATSSIEDSAFEGCSGIRVVSFGNGIKSIGDNAFKGCSALTTVEIPESVEEIGKGAFSGCSRLSSVSMPFGVSVGEEAFPANVEMTLI